jgi:acyl dehydratase
MTGREKAQRLEGPIFRVDRAKIAAYAELTADFNPIHMDDVFAQGTPFGGVIAHGMLSLNLVWELLRELADGAVDGLNLRTRFQKPVRPGDTVRACAQADDAVPDLWHIWVENQNGERVIVSQVRIPAK